MTFLAFVVVLIVIAIALRIFAGASLSTVLFGVLLPIWLSMMVLQLAETIGVA